jgi:hypothetical protein
MRGNLVGSLGRLCCAEPGDLRAATWVASAAHRRPVVPMSALPALVIGWFV